MPAIIGLIIAAVVIYLYCLLVGWLFTYCGPMTLVLSGLFGLGTVLCVYGWTLFQVFLAEARIKIAAVSTDAGVQSKGWRSLFWIPAGALLALVYLDWAYILLAPMPEPLKFQALYDFSSEMLWPVVSLQLKWLPFTSFMAPVRGALDHGTWMAPILLSVTLKELLILPLLLCSRGLANPLTGGSQPARLQYFYKQAFIDLRNTVEWSLLNLQDLAVWIFAILWVVNYGPQALFIWPLTLTIVAALVISIIVGFVALALMLALHGLLLVLIISAVWFFALILFCAERAVILSRRGYAKCPHAGCHAPVPLPAFLCGACGKEHDRLVPGRYGVLYRRCSCGGKLLPTLFWLGKGKLPSVCPRCHMPMHEGLFAANVHIPIYGGPSSGKTMFMMAATWKLMGGGLRNIRASFIDERQKMDYSSRWKPEFESGRVRDKTVSTLPDAFLLSLRGRFGLPVSLYTYDPAGEALGREEELSGHRFLKYFDGLALLIDPFSLPSMAQRYAAEIPKWEATTSRIDPLDMVNRVINVLEELAKLSRRRRFRRKVAVIITKADLPIVQRELGITLKDETPKGDWSRLGTADSETIKAWLLRNEPSLLQLLTTRFSDLRFFATSSLGAPPDTEAKPFQPRNVLQPLCWLLSTRNALTFPAAARIGGRLAELSAVALVASLLLVAPGFAAYQWGIPKARIAWADTVKRFETASSGAMTPAINARLIPSPPEPTGPSQGEYVAGSQVILKWKPAAGATRYVTQIAENSLFNNAHTSTEGRSSESTWTGLPNNGRTFYWRVKAGSDVGWSNYSPFQSFNNAPKPQDGGAKAARNSNSGNKTVSSENAPSSATQTGESDVPAGARVTAEISKADDVCSVYINGNAAVKAAWGKGPQGQALGFKPGFSGEVDIAQQLRRGRNLLRFTVWNRAAPRLTSGRFVVRVNDRVVYDRGIDKEDSTEGIKFDEEYALNAESEMAPAVPAQSSDIHISCPDTGEARVPITIEINVANPANAQEIGTLALSFDGQNPTLTAETTGCDFRRGDSGKEVTYFDWDGSAWAARDKAVPIRNSLIELYKPEWAAHANERIRLRATFPRAGTVRLLARGTFASRVNNVVKVDHNIPGTGTTDQQGLPCAVHVIEVR